jgi:hypothetical protein
MDLDSYHCGGGHTLCLVAAPESWAGQLSDERPQVGARRGMDQDHRGMDQAGHGDAMIKRHEEVLARLSATDDRIEALVADMHMFTGALKVAAMDELLTAIVERQSAMIDEMRMMHGGMMGSVVQRPVPDVRPLWPNEEPEWSAEELEAGMMCAPVF